MKKRSRIKWISIPLAIVLVLSFFAISAFAGNDDPTVTLDGAKGEFVFSNVADIQNPDLFKNMKGLMPGDSVTQDIVVGVKNFDNIEAKTVTVMLKATPTEDAAANKDYDDIMKQATFTVKQGDRELTGNIKSGVELKTFDSNATADMQVSLNIPLSAGNELANMEGKVLWEFYVATGPQLNKDDHFAYIIGYPDGNVRPNNKITRAEVATIFFRLLTDDSRNAYLSTKNSFSDVPSNAWFNRAVSTLVNAGVLSGYPDGTFRPDAAITRAEMATIATKFDAVMDADSGINVPPFPDVADNHWAKENILKAASRGWVNGYPDGTFRPERQIERAEAMKLINYVLNRVVDEQGLQNFKGIEFYNEWADNPKMNASGETPWFYYHIQEATNSHDYYRSDRPCVDLPDVNIEDWKVVTAAPDWKKWESAI